MNLKVEDLRFEVFRTMWDITVKVIHIPTGLTASADSTERELAGGGYLSVKAEALQRLTERLEKAVDDMPIV